MAIRDTWNRMVRKSFSSSSSGGRSDDGQDIAAPGTAGTSPTPSVPLSKSPPSRLGGLSRMTTWRSNTSQNHHSHSKEGSGGSGDSTSRKPSPKRSAPQKSIMKKNRGGAFPARVHPSERPLTEQNLRHQEMLGTFTMKFGRSRRFSRGARSNFSGVSPRCSVDSSPGAAVWDDKDRGGQGCHGRMSSAVAPDEARIAEESS